MTLTIPDVEQWNPALLSTAGAGVGKLSGDLDQAVLAGVNGTQAIDWSGKAAAAADDRMTAEKSRASSVSQAALQLQTALTQQVDNLQHTKDEVVRLRNLAQNAPTPPGPFTVDPNGTVTAEDRKNWLRDTLPDNPDTDKLLLQEDVEAQRRTVELTQALAQAAGVAEAAVRALNDAKTQLDQSGTDAPPIDTSPPTAPAAASVPSSPNSNGSSSGAAHSGGSSSGGSSSAGMGSDSGASFPGSGSSSGSSGAPASGGPPSITPSGDVGQWVAQAKQVLLEMGYRPDQIDEQALAVIVEKESGGDPNAINLTDSNAAAGHPSKGLMQTIDSTFSSYAAPGHNDIWNPVDNIVAGARYSIDRYGSVRHPGVESYMSGGQYQGY